MKKLLIATAFLALPTAALADTMTITYPKDACVEILGTDFSAPSSDSSTYLFEMLCKDAEGIHKLFITSWKTKGAFFGFGRSIGNTQINLEPGSVSTLIKR